MEFLPRIYPITDTFISGLSHAEQVRLLIEGGASFIQIREKKASSRKFYLDAREAVTIARQKGAKIIINDRIDIALAVNADGVHLGQEDIPPRYARKILGDHAIIGYSTHNFRQAVEALKMPINYISIGPIFPTKTKENPDPVVGLEEIKLIKQAIGDFPLVAIGGINLENIKSVFEAGADCVAVVSAIVSEPNKITEKMMMFNKIQK
ncbi:MAG: thiamine phosphate synthase [Acidobacteria bacterium]|jgi:thiamine-phosphate pyrophosphorylase|nr:MAG: thiamine phosphate synthase [Acidobacteriota bacterium]GIU81478.1 MAG: thiamine-phosphate synthase [Pyrinomonadaceae bacterium]